jgi:Polysaccharide pyruvyl transferase
MRPLNLYLAFDFYGAGNIGDDLSLAGLLAGIAQVAQGRPTRLVSTTPHDLASQRARFPDIEWLDPPELARWVDSREAGNFAWLGAGDTPFQVLSGPWMSQFLQKHARHWSRFSARLMANIGSEREAAGDAATFAPIARQLDRISTRDQASLDLLRTSFDCRPDRLFAGGDLAHLVMPGLVGLLGTPANGSRQPRFDLGLIPASYMLARHEVEAVGSFIADAPAPIAWIANDVRCIRGMERHALLFLAERFGPAWRERVHLLVPAYADASLAELFDPIADCRTILSSRYHGLLIGAWLGKRVAGFGNTSKVADLARDLGIPMFPGPLTPEGLAQLARAATSVPRKRLEPHAVRALAGLRFALDA